MFDWTRSSWFFGLLVVVLTVGGIAGIVRFIYRRGGNREPRAVLLYYNVAAFMMLLLATVFIARWIVELVL